MKKQKIEEITVDAATVENTFDANLLGEKVIEREIASLSKLKLIVATSNQFREAVEMILAVHGKGHLILMGVGKSGHIGKKIAATMASTGTPAFFVHATEAAHGDLGMVSANDCVIAISNSGRTDELLNVIGSIRLIGAKLIAITSSLTSPLARSADVVLDLGVTDEADPLGLAPTNSSTATLALGDALAVTVSQMKKFTRLQFGTFHPGGALGRAVMGVQYPRFAAAGQLQVFRYADKLTPEQKMEFEKSLETIDLKAVHDIFVESQKNSALLQMIMKQNEDGYIVDESLKIKPLISSSIPSSPASASLTSNYTILSDQTDAAIQRWREIGYNAIAKGQVGLIAVAGGQADYIGKMIPRGMLDVGLPSHKSLFQLAFERLKKLKELVSTHTKSKSLPVLPVYVMTSEANHSVTMSYFAQNENFGIPQADVYIFPQGSMPVMTVEGKMILESQNSLLKSPDGHGGVFDACLNQGIIKDMKRRGIEHVFLFAVDNVLVKVADPVYIGYCIDKKADLGCRTVERVKNEPAGVICKRNNRLLYLEHKILPQSIANLHVDNDEEKPLLYNNANIMNLYFSFPFFEKTANSKPFWRSTTKTVTEADGSHVNGIIFEKNVLDCIANAENVAILLSDRSHCFAPIKHTWGYATDSPDSAAEILSSLHKSWVLAAGGKIENESNGICEVSPTISYEGENLTNIVKGKTFTLPLNLN